MRKYGLSKGLSYLLWAFMHISVHFQGWQPPFACDVDKLHFVPRIQRLNELEVSFSHESISIMALISPH